MNSVGERGGGGGEEEEEEEEEEEGRRENKKMIERKKELIHVIYSIIWRASVASETLTGYPIENRGCLGGWRREVGEGVGAGGRGPPEGGARGRATPAQTARKRSPGGRPGPPEHLRKGKGGPPPL